MDLLIEKFLMKLKAQQIGNGHDNMTSYTQRCKDCKFWLEECGSKIFVDDQTEDVKMCLLLRQKCPYNKQANG